jgi:hypothetical protein
MTGAADDRIMWLAGLLCRPTRREAAHAVTIRAIATAGFDAAGLLQNAGTLLIDDRNERLREFGNRVRATDPVLALAFEMVALGTDDSAATASSPAQSACCAAPMATPAKRVRGCACGMTSLAASTPATTFSNSPKCTGAARCSSSSPPVQEQQ